MAENFIFHFDIFDYLLIEIIEYFKRCKRQKVKIRSKNKENPLIRD